MDETVVKAENLHKSFDGPTGHVDVLRGVSLHVGSGEVVALVGRSGSGKSTLLNLLGALALPDQGTIRIGTTDLATLDDQHAAHVRRTQVGFVFQAGNLLPHLTAVQNVALPYAQGIKAGRPVAAALLEQVGLAERADHRPNQLSAGQQQRVALARALVNQPTLVLADEPTGNLDGETEAQMLALLRSTAVPGRAVLVVTHSEAVSTAADRVIRIDSGRLMEQETV